MQAELKAFFHRLDRSGHQINSSYTRRYPAMDERVAGLLLRLGFECAVILKHGCECCPVGRIPFIPGAQYVASETTGHKISLTVMTLGMLESHDRAVSKQSGTKSTSPHFV